jgi:hypothetical protein
MNHRAFHFISPPGGLHRACIGGLHLILRRLIYDWRWLSFPRLHLILRGLIYDWRWSSFPRLPFHHTLLRVGRGPR